MVILDHLVIFAVNKFNTVLFALSSWLVMNLLQTGPNASAKEDWGVNYRALNDLFHISRSRINTIMYEVSVQMVEIYNEQVRDLLTNDASQKKYPFMQTIPSHFNTYDLSWFQKL